MEIKLEQHTCAYHGCGVSFWMPEAFGERRREDHQRFFCPNGHPLVYKGQTDAQKLARITREKNDEIARLTREKIIANVNIERLQKQLVAKRRKRRSN
jgi:hypothetical protein